MSAFVRVKSAVSISGRWSCDGSPEKSTFNASFEIVAASVAAVAYRGSPVAFDASAHWALIARALRLIVPYVSLLACTSLCSERYMVSPSHHPVAGAAVVVVAPVCAVALECPLPPHPANAAVAAARRPIEQRTRIGETYRRYACRVGPDVVAVMPSSKPRTGREIAVDERYPPCRRARGAARRHMTAETGCHAPA